MRKLLTEIDNNAVRFRDEPFLFIVLAAVLMNLFGYAIYFCYLLVPVFFVIFYNNRQLIDQNLIFIFLFSIFYTIILFINKFDVQSKTITVGYLIFPSLFYFIGKYLVSKYNSILTIYFVILGICLFFSVLPFLANVRSVIENGFMQDRNIRMFWMDEGQVRAATGVGSYFAINLALLPLIFVPKRTATEKKLAIFLIVLFGIAFFSILNMSNRTGLGITIFSLLALILVPNRNQTKIIFSVILFIFIIIILYISDAWGIRLWFENSVFFARLNNTDINEQGSRFLIWKYAFITLSNNLYGYTYDFRSIIGAGYAHNLWLDVGLKTGIIPLFLLLIFTLSAGINIIKIVFNNKYDIFLRVLICGLGIGFYLTFFVEPIIEGMLIMFFVFCLCFGMLTALRKIF